MLIACYSLHSPNKGILAKRENLKQWLGERCPQSSVSWVCLHEWSGWQVGDYLRVLALQIIFSHWKFASVFATLLRGPSFLPPDWQPIRFTCRFQGRLFLHHSRPLSMQDARLCLCVCTGTHVGLPRSRSPCYFGSQGFVANECFGRMKFLSSPSLPLCLPFLASYSSQWAMWLSPWLSLLERTNIFTAAWECWCEVIVCRCFHDTHLFLLQIQLYWGRGWGEVRVGRLGSRKTLWFPYLASSAGIRNPSFPFPGFPPSQTPKLLPPKIHLGFMLLRWN